MSVDLESAQVVFHAVEFVILPNLPVIDDGRSVIGDRHFVIRDGGVVIGDGCAVIFITRQQPGVFVF